LGIDLPDLGIGERFDHGMLLRHPANPAIGLNRHP
jgi:hypothetical protein